MKSGNVKSAIVAMLLLILTGCSTISISGEKGATNLYNLTPKSTFTDLPHVDWKLAVAEPVATAGLDSKRIALHPNPTEVKYFADASWTERAPQMIQTLLLESFTHSDDITLVGRDAVSLRPDYILKSELREFQAEYFHGSAEPLIRVRLNATLIDQSRQEIVATESFEAAVASTGTDMSSIILAFDMALGKVMRRTVEWTLTKP